MPFKNALERDFTLQAKSHSIEELPTPFLKCRVFGHSWDEYIPVGKRKPDFGFRLSMLCISCGTERHDLIGATGAVIQRSYDYPAGYQVSFKMDRSDARVAYQGRKRQIARRGHLLKLVK